MEHREALIALRTFLSTQILGQEKLIERLLIALLADGHMLVEGAPGLAKTKAIKELIPPAISGWRLPGLSRTRGTVARPHQP